MSSNSNDQLSKSIFENRGASAAVHKLLEVSSSSESDEEGQAFYVGGSERSGQQVIGPPRNKGKPSGDLIGDMFKSARECVHLTHNFIKLSILAIKWKF